MRVSQIGYHIHADGVSMDRNTVAAVTNWPEPSTVKELQQFMGFANFYLRFIWNFSTVAVPMTDLLKGRKKGGKLIFSPEACAAFDTLKRWFTSAPVLKTPDPVKPFIVEVDTSEVGIETISQRQGTREKLHPCTFFSRKLTPGASSLELWLVDGSGYEMKAFTSDFWIKGDIWNLGSYKTIISVRLLHAWDLDFYIDNLQYLSHKWLIIIRHHFPTMSSGSEMVVEGAGFSALKSITEGDSRVPFDGKNRTPLCRRSFLGCL